MAAMMQPEKEKTGLLARNFSSFSQLKLQHFENG